MKKTMYGDTGASSLTSRDRAHGPDGLVLLERRRAYLVDGVTLDYPVGYLPIGLEPGEFHGVTPFASSRNLPIRAPSVNIRCGHGRPVRHRAAGPASPSLEVASPEQAILPGSWDG